MNTLELSQSRRIEAMIITELVQRYQAECELLLVQNNLISPERLDAISNRDKPTENEFTFLTGAIPLPAEQLLKIYLQQSENGKRGWARNRQAFRDGSGAIVKTRNASVSTC